MDRKEIRLYFGNNLYTRDNLDTISFEQGIYVAYTGKPNDRYVVLNQLLYIGMADGTNIKDRLRDHIENQHTEWSKHCKSNEQIYYRIAELKHDIRATEAAMIFVHKPMCNTNDKTSYSGTHPAPNVYTDLAISDVDGALVDALSLINRMDRP